MEQEEKEILLKDLSARLPYGVKCKINLVGSISPKAMTSVYSEGNIGFGINKIQVEAIRPYLFPLSSITEEQNNEYNDLCFSIFPEEGDDYYLDSLDSIDWLNAHHFDYRGLIEKGLAIDATGKNIY